MRIMREKTNKANPKTKIQTKPKTHQTKQKTKKGVLQNPSVARHSAYVLFTASDKPHSKIRENKIIGSKCREVTSREESSSLQPSESSQVCLCFHAWFRPLRNCQLYHIHSAHSSFVLELLLCPPSQRATCAFLPFSSQYSLLRIPNNLYESLYFFVPTQDEFQVQFLQESLSCWDSATFPFLQDSPLTKSLFCNPGKIKADTNLCFARLILLYNQAGNIYSAYVLCNLLC